MISSLLMKTAICLNNGYICLNSCLNNGYNENLLKLRNLTPEENVKGMKTEFNSIKENLINGII